jgi:hypothetical protein
VYFSMSGLVLVVLIASAATSVGCYCWRAARRRRRHRCEWARLAIELKDPNDDLDWVWAAEQGGSGRHR